MIERDRGDACIGGRKLFQRSRQRVRIEHVDMKDVDEGTLADQPIRRALDLFGQVRHETVAAGRQNEGEAETLVARQPCRGWIGAVTEPRHGRLDPRDGLFAHPLAPVDHAVDGRKRNPRDTRDVFKRRASGGAGFAIRHQRAAHNRPRVMIVLISGTSSS